MAVNIGTFSQPYTKKFGIHEFSKNNDKFLLFPMSWRNIEYTIYPVILIDTINSLHIIKIYTFEITNSKIFKG